MHVWNVEDRYGNKWPTVEDIGTQVAKDMGESSAMQIALCKNKFAAETAAWEAADSGEEDEQVGEEEEELEEEGNEEDDDEDEEEEDEEDDNDDDEKEEVEGEEEIESDNDKKGAVDDIEEEEENIVILPVRKRLRKNTSVVDAEESEREDNSADITLNVSTTESRESQHSPTSKTTTTLDLTKPTTAASPKVEQILSQEQQEQIDLDWLLLEADKECQSQEDLWTQHMHTSSSTTRYVIIPLIHMLQNSTHLIYIVMFQVLLFVRPPLLLL